MDLYTSSRRPLAGACRVASARSGAISSWSGRCHWAWTTVLATLLLAPGTPAHTEVAAADYTVFYGAVHAGDTQAAMVAGRSLYTHLALEAEGGEPFCQAGVWLISVRQAADYVVQLYAEPNRSAGSGPAESLWRTLRAVTPQPGMGLGEGERALFLRNYLNLYVSHQIGRVLAAAGAARPPSDAVSTVVTDHLILLLAALDAESMANQPAVSQTMGWIVGYGQSERAIAQALAHGRPAIACALSQVQLSQRPADPATRKQFLALVGELCKTQHIQEAVSLCEWAREYTQDSAYGGVLLLQQAIIAARDQEDLDSAIRLCDHAADTATGAATIQLAGHLAAVYCLNKGDHAETRRRAEILLQNPDTTLLYKLKASSLMATSFLRQKQAKEAVRVLTDILADLAEPEPAEAAEARQLLCQALLETHSFEEASRQAQILASRHPTHPAAKTAREMARQFSPKPDDAATGSAK